MKTFFALLFLLLALVLSAGAQTFGGGTAITGVTNVACKDGNGNPITNLFYATFPAKSVVLSGVGNTNEVFIGSFYLSLPGYTNVTAGLTNLYWLASVTNSFASGTNSGTWTTNLVGGVVVIPFPLIMSANIGIYSNSIYVP